MGIFDVFVAVIWGIVEGITEWLPVSSTGHMILVEEFLKFQDEQFSQMFLVVVQLGAILAVVLLFWSRIWPFRFTKRERGESIIDWKIMQMWFKIIVACLPAAIVGILFDDWIDEVFYNAYVVAGALIVYGILFIIVENWNKGRKSAITSVTEIGYDTALIIGIFQLLAAVVPGTSRSGATIIGALLLGVARGAAAEFTFYLAIPVMFGVGDFVELNPEGEIHRDSPVVAHDLDVARFDALLHAETDGEAFGLERTGLLGGLPLLDAVGDGRGEVVEAADDGVNLFGGT